MLRFVAEDEMIGLRPMEYEDCERIVFWRNQESVRKQYIYREEFSLENERKFFDENIRTGKMHILMICDKKLDGKAIGCTVINREEDDGSAEYGLFIGDESRRRMGIGRRATAMTLEYAFREWKYPRITARVFVDNTVSRKSAVAGGLKETGILKDVVCSDGAVKDMITYEALPAD